MDAAVDARSVVNEVIGILRENWRVKQPTKYELILSSALEAANNGEFFDINRIAELYDGDTKRAGAALSKLNSRYLNPRGINLGKQHRIVFYQTGND